MANASTITEISDSSDLVWELVCKREDGIDITPAEFRALSDADMRIFQEEDARMGRKWEKARAFEKLANPPASFTPAPRITGPDYEGMILARQARDLYWNC